MLADAIDVGEDGKERIKRIMRERRDLDLEIADLEEKISAKRQRKNDIDYTILPELFATEGITKLGVPAEGNHPAMTGSLGDHCKAVIRADWPDDRKRVAFDRLDALGLSDIVKNVISVTLNRGEDAEARRVAKLLEDANVVYQRSRDVHWGTLTAAVKDLRDRGADLDGQALDEIGAVIGKVVKIK